MDGMDLFEAFFSILFLDFNPNRTEPNWTNFRLLHFSTSSLFYFFTSPLLLLHVQMSLKQSICFSVAIQVLLVERK